MFRPEFMSASDTTEDKFTFAVATAIDVPSFDHCSWTKDQEAMENATDISRTTEVDFKEEKGRLQLLLDLTGQIVSNLEIRQLLRTTSAMVCRMIQCNAVAIHLPDKESSSLQLFAIHYHEHASRNQENNDRVEGSTSGDEVCRVFRSRKPILSRDNAGCVLPLISGDRVLGVMELNRQKEDVLLYEDLEFVSQIAKQV